MEPIFCEKTQRLHENMRAFPICTAVALNLHITQFRPIYRKAFANTRFCIQKTTIQIYWINVNVDWTIKQRHIDVTGKIQRNGVWRHRKMGQKRMLICNVIFNKFTSYVHIIIYVCEIIVSGAYFCVWINRCFRCLQMRVR